MSRVARIKLSLATIACGSTDDDNGLMIPASVNSDDNAELAEHSYQTTAPRSSVSALEIGPRVRATISLLSLELANQRK